MDVSTSLMMPPAIGFPPNTGGESLAGRNARPSPAAIESAAQGFESLFASMLIKQMRQTLEPDTLFGQDSGDVLGGMFDLYLGQHIAQAGGLGIADMVRQQLRTVGRS